MADINIIKLKRKAVAYAKLQKQLSAMEHEVKEEMQNYYYGIGCLMLPRFERVIEQFK